MKRDKIVVYLDTSVYNRPFDDQSQMRIRLETEAFLSIYEKATTGDIVIIGSSALYYENNQNPFAKRKERVADYLLAASNIVRLSEAIKKRASLLESIRIDPIDALHIASAEAGGAEYFITCDDDIIKKSQRHEAFIKIKVCSPLEFILKGVYKNA